MADARLQGLTIATFIPLLEAVEVFGLFLLLGICCRQSCCRCSWSNAS
jgi:hypothetical protein